MRFVYHSGQTRPVDHFREGWISDIWAHRLNPVTKHPRGRPFAVYDFHQTRRAPNFIGSASFGPAVGKNQITFSMLEQSANIWIAEQSQ